MPRRRAWVLLLLALAPVPASSADRWLSARTQHFDVLGNVGEGQLRRVALKFEQFRAVLDEVLIKGQEPAGSPELPRPLVFVFKDRKSYKPYLPLEGGKPVEVGGYFQPGHGRHYITLTLAGWSDDPYHVIFHEYVHFLASRGARQPSWFSEGIAEFHSSNDLDSRPVKLGLPVRAHVLALREEKPLPLERLLAMTQPPPHDREAMRLYYAQAWLFVHYLMAERENGRAQLKAFLRGLDTGQELRAAFVNAFAVDLPVMEKELRNYARGSGFRYFPFEASVAYEKQVSIEPLAALEAEARLAELEAQLPERQAQGRARLEKLAEQNPQLAMAREALAALARARTVLTVHEVVAGTTPPEPPGGLTGRSLATLSKRVNDLMQAPAPEAAAELEAALRAFIDSNPGASDAFLMLAQVRETQGAPMAEKLELAEKALAADGDAPRPRIYLARVKRRLLDLEGARRTLDEGIQRTRDADHTAQFAQELEMLKDLHQVKGALVDLRCGGAGGALDFVVEAASRRLVLRAESPTSFTVVRDGEQVMAELTCGRQRRAAVALYRVSDTPRPGVDGELATISLPEK